MKYSRANVAADHVPIIVDEITYAFRDAVFVPFTLWGSFCLLSLVALIGSTALAADRRSRVVVLHRGRQIR